MRVGELRRGRAGAVYRAPEQLKSAAHVHRIQDGMKPMRSIIISRRHFLSSWTSIFACSREHGCLVPSPHRQIESVKCRMDSRVRPCVRVNGEVSYAVISRGVTRHEGDEQRTPRSQHNHCTLLQRSKKNCNEWISCTPVQSVVQGPATSESYRLPGRRSGFGNVWLRDLSVGRPKRTETWMDEMRIIATSGSYALQVYVKG